VDEIMVIPRNIIDGIDTLDPLPVTLQHLTSSLSDEDFPLSEVAKIVEYDQAVVANMLKVANSVYFSGRTRIETVRTAVVRLGTSNLLNIVLGQYMKTISADTPLYDLTEHDLWLHSVVSSLAAEEIMKNSKLEIPRETPIAALLHDVGKLIMVRYFESDFRPVLALCQEKDITFVEAERELFGCDHAEVGGAVAKKWGFPEEIILAVERHHDFEVLEPQPVLDTVVMSNLVAKTLATGLGAEGMNLWIDNRCPSRLGLDFKGFCIVSACVAERLDEVKNSFGISDTHE
jgi:putative nucleotidyltransferase with HDIG domain